MKEPYPLLLTSSGSVIVGLLLAHASPQWRDSSAREAARPARIEEGGLARRDGSNPASTDADDEKLAMRRTVAKCETAALWDWLKQAAADDWNWKDLVVSELVDRLGWQALDIAMEMEPDRVDGELSGHVLSKLGESDPWKAYELWKSLRGEFENERWGQGTIDWAIQAGASASGEKLIEVLQQMTADESESLMVIEFTEGFDFRTVLDFLAEADRQPLTVPENLLPAWAEQSPVEAAAWLLDHPEFLEVEHQEYAANRLLRAIAAGEGPEAVRHEALAQLASMPSDYLDMAWKAIGESSDGKLDANTLESAGLMNRREDYLSRSLLETRSLDVLDASWDLVPLEERRTALRTAEQIWAERQPTPVQARARERWKMMVTTAWRITP